MSLEESVMQEGNAELDVRLRDCLGFSIRARKAFDRLGVITIGDLVGKTSYDFHCLRNCAGGTVREIEGFLDSRGYGLKDDARGGPRGYRGKATREAIEGAIVGGAGTRKEIADKLGISYSGSAERIKEYGIEVSRAPGSGSKKINDVLAKKFIKRGLPLIRIAERFKVVPQRMSQYVDEKELREIWERSRVWYKNPERKRFGVLSNILAGVQRHTYDKAPWEERKALEYMKSRQVVSKNSYSFDSLVELFRVYREAEEKGKKLSLENFQERTGIGFPQVGRILKRVGLEPMHGVRERSSPIMEE